MFESHKVNDEGIRDIELFKNTMAKAVNLAKMMMPESKAKTVFLTHIETAVFYGTKALAAKPENHTEVIIYPRNTL